jgi:hypothetical protein
MGFFFWLALIVLGLYFNGWFGAAFWIVVAYALNGLGGLVRAFQNPEAYWHRHQRQMYPDQLFSLPSEKAIAAELRSLVIVKVVATALLGMLAWHLAVLAGYIGSSN